MILEVPIHNFKLVYNLICNVSPPFKLKIYCVWLNYPFKPYERDEEYHNLQPTQTICFRKMKVKHVMLFICIIYVICSTNATILGSDPFEPMGIFFAINYLVSSIFVFIIFWQFHKPSDFDIAKTFCIIREQFFTEEIVKVLCM